MKKLKPKHGLGSRLLKKIVKSGDGVFNPTIKEYSSNTEMFKDFLNQAKKQNVKIDRESELYKQIKDEVPSLRTYYEGTDLKNQLKKELAPIVGGNYEKNEAVKHMLDFSKRKLNDAQKQGDLIEAKLWENKIKDYSKDSYMKANLEDISVSNLETYFKNKPSLDPYNTLDRLYARRETDKILNLLQSEKTKALYKNEPDKLVENLSNYEVNSILDPNKSLLQNQLSTDVLNFDNPLVPAIKELKNYKKSDKELQEMIETHNTLFNEYSRTQDASLLPELSALYDSIANIRDYKFVKNNTNWVNSLKNKFTKKASLSDQDIVDGTYLSISQAKAPNNVKFVTRNEETYDNPYQVTDNKWGSDSEIIKGDSQNTGFFAKPSVKGDWGTPNITLAPKLKKSIYREHLGKWDWNDPNDHRVIGAGVLLGAGSTQLKTGGRLKRLKSKNK